MEFNKQRVKKHLDDANFNALFIEELGWDRPPASETLAIDGANIKLDAVAEKRGLVVFTCAYEKDGKIPDSNLRRKIDNALAKLVREHLIIFVSANKSYQEWQWIRREPGKTAALRTESFQKGQTGERLIQKLGHLYVSLRDEDGFTLSDATSRVRAAFDLERVTKKFYDEFKKKHGTFLSFIDGIPDDEFRRWYASVMLNRLMFIYFLQKKGFLDGGNLDYLRNRLALVVDEHKGSFYKKFLCPLFFEGFAKKEKDRSAQAKKLLGNIPYLNGGLFTKHQVEERYGAKIDISDSAFEDLFEFFERYQWHLDERALKRDNEINPDVLGYIFEKYVNQKQMGAYYTKEDITEYISKNTMIPWLFDTASKKCKIAFEPASYLWQLLKGDPDRYIYPAMRHGVTFDVRDNKPLPSPHTLPAEIKGGIKTIEKRGDWNKTAPDDYALPTETWREVIARRKRYDEVKSHIADGKVSSIEDFITLNLDIRQFARDAIQYAEGPEFVRAFWQALQKITVLDPACGSGAFLFAALNILEDLYDACLERMQAFVDELDKSDDFQKSTKMKDFRETLARIAQHPNRKYFIYKTIIVQNLYGVDIMEEATEICKLRLFLKLASQLESPEKIEPLPDIDFNIKAGNSLIGYTSFDDVRKAVERKGFDFDNTLEKLKQRTEDLDALFVEFRRQQIEEENTISLEAKQQLKSRLVALEEDLNHYIAKDYGINLDQTNLELAAKYEKWKHSHKPFHWLIEFYGIINNGGFDAIIGNPPYLETREVDYTLTGFETIDTKAIHAVFMEMSLKILHQNGAISMIVPLSLVSTQRMKVVQALIENSKSAWYANYAWRPGKLFDTVNRALTIFIAKPSATNDIHTTSYQKWNADSRQFLISSLCYAEVTRDREAFWVPKFKENIETSILSKLLRQRRTAFFYIGRSDHKIFYRTDGGLYWKVFTATAPKFILNGTAGNSSRETTFSLREKSHVLPMICALSSNTFWYWYTITSNLRHLNPTDIHSFPIPEGMLDDPLLQKLGKAYLKDLDANSKMLTRVQRQTGTVQTQSFKIQKSKSIIDEIDKVLAKHYGFTDEQLDFIINYDIKYRMGADEAGDYDE